MILSTMESEEIIRMPDSNFIDYVKIFCASGHGGAGPATEVRVRFTCTVPSTSRREALTVATAAGEDTSSCAPTPSSGL